MSRISTHVLDTSTGKPAPGIAVHLFFGDEEICTARTDLDGRCANLLMPGSTIQSGTYRLVYEVEIYFPHGFYPEVSISFQGTEGTPHYHVPLLLSPFGYTTYRGS